MRAVISLARADLRARWRGWLAVILLVGMASAIVLATIAGARRTDTAFGRFLASSGGAQAEIAPSGPGGRQNVGGLSSFYAAVAELPGVELVAPTVGMSAVDTERGNAEVQLQAGSDARFGRSIERPKLVEGRMFDPARVDEVVADHSATRRLHLRVGSVLHLLVRPATGSGPVDPNAPLGRPVTVHVVGVGVTRDNVVPVTAFSSGSSLLVTPTLLNLLTPAFYNYDAAFVRLKPGESFAAFARHSEALLSAHPETGGELNMIDERQSTTKVGRAIHPEAVTLALFALLVAITALIVGGQILVRQVSATSSIHPKLRALGMTRSQLAAIGLADVGVAVFLGAAVGDAGAIALSAFMPIGPAKLAEPHPGLAINWVISGMGTFAIMATFVAAVAPSRGPVAGHAGGPQSGPSGGGIGRPSRILTILGRTNAPVVSLVGARLALEPGRGRDAVPIRSAIAGTAVAVAAVTAAFTFGANLVRLVSTPPLYGQSWQMSVDAQYASMNPAEVGTFLRAQPGVSSWTFGNHAYATIADRHVATLAMAGEGEPTFPSLLEGRVPRAPDEIVLGTKSLADAHRRVGEPIAVRMQGEGATRTMRIVGRAVFPFFGQGQDTPTSLGDGAAILETRPVPDGFNFFLVRMMPGPGEHANVARLVHELGRTGLCQRNQPRCGAVTAQRPSDINNYARIKSTPLALAAVLAMLAVATITHLLVTSIHHRRRDFAVLKTLGFLRRQVSAAVAWQATIIVSLSLLLGLPLGVALGQTFWRLFSARLGVHPDARVPLVPLVLSVPLALALANAIAAAPARMAVRVRPAPVLRRD
ncbi:MAG: hypothetical protein NVS3B12_33450 [Acidimicrobiales bacterium]